MTTILKSIQATLARRREEVSARERQELGLSQQHTAIWEQVQQALSTASLPRSVGKLSVLNLRELARSRQAPWEQLDRNVDEQISDMEWLSGILTNAFMNQSSNYADRNGIFGQALQVLALSHGLDVYKPVDTTKIEECADALELLQLLVRLHAKTTQDTLKARGLDEIPLKRDVPKKFKNTHWLMESWTSLPIARGAYSGGFLLQESIEVQRILAVRQVESEYLVMPCEFNIANAEDSQP